MLESSGRTRECSESNRRNQETTGSKNAMDYVGYPESELGFLNAINN